MMNRLARSPLSLCVMILLFAAGRYAQSSVSEGINSFNKGDFQAAIQQLKNSGDPTELNLLGQSYEKLGKKNEARKAYEHSLKSGYALFEMALLDWTTSKVDSSFAAMLKDLSQVLTMSLSSAERGMRLKTDIFELNNEWRLRANTLFAMKQLEISGEEVYRPGQMDAALKLLTRPKANGNKCNATRTVQLWVLFHADGQTVAVIPRSKWKDGCNEAAIAAAMLMEFEPAQKTGKAVGTLNAVEYSFR